MQQHADGNCFAGYLKQIEAIGPLKSTRRRWFVLEDDAHFVYYYRLEKDKQPLGRIYLPTAIFSFDPKQQSTFEIHSNGEVFVLEAPDEQARFSWLQALQNQRRQCIETQMKEFADEPADSMKLPDLSEFLPGYSTCPETTDSAGGAAVAPSESLSVFYINESGQLKKNSLECPTGGGGGKRFPFSKQDNSNVTPVPAKMPPAEHINIQSLPVSFKDHHGLTSLSGVPILPSGESCYLKIVCPHKVYQACP
ncbi:PH domain protein [Trichuris suis]|nr:PH domain protein [Trichuris suis]